MRLRRIVRYYALALAIQSGLALGPVVLPRPAGAHEFTMESLMSAFFKIEPREAQFVLRVPLHVLKSAKFPLSGREIDLASADAAIQRALTQLGREIMIWETGQPLLPSRAIGRLSLPSDRSFERYTDAVTHVARTSAPGTVIYADQGYLDAHLTYPISSPNSRFMIQTTIAPELKNYLKLVIRYLPMGQDGRAMMITSYSGRVALNPTWYQAAGGFVELGVVHILGGLDHLLFLLCLLIPVRSMRDILRIVTAFTVGHSVTLLGSVYNLAPAGAWFPPLIETLIALSIMYMALENIIGVDLRRRWLIAALLGLIHGFGFAYGLKENLQFAGQHLLVSLFSFNFGIEIGQVLVLMVMLPVLALLLRHLLIGRIGMIILSVMVAHVAWHWMIERGDVLWRIEWPVLNGPELAVLARWIAGLLLAGLVVRFFARRTRNADELALASLAEGESPGVSSNPRLGIKQ